MITLDVSCTFAPSARTPELVAHAESLGYARAWVYDSPALYGDVWMTLARAADRTERIGLGPAVLVPSLRHPAVTASAIALLEELAPGRVAAALGTGFSGRYALGRPRLRWQEVADYVRTLRALLAGETAEWDGATIKLLDRDPVKIPLLIGADGPKGQAVAAELADGSFRSSLAGAADNLPTWRAMPVFGTVLQDGETLESERVWQAAAPHVAVALHAMLEDGNTTMLDALPGGKAWREEADALPAGTRHLALHEGHLLRVTPRDEDVVRQNLGLLSLVTVTGSAQQLRDRVAGFQAGGLTELVYQPTGDDLEGELERFIGALRD